ncbi:MAG TPA: hypothetical protein VFF64_08270 [Candidatus Eremiobacteraceae bacterium]|nr:hypothetical protein [Candidatus Eremiobacteraceae bacterium]
MSRMKFVLAALLITAIVGVVPQAHTQVPQVILAGSSAMWQAMALAAYNSGHCVSGATAPCHHYTAKNFNLSDERPTAKGGSTAVDLGNVWIVWDSSASPKVWVYSKVDSGVGDRCYFAQPHCTINITTFPAAGNLISSTLWGDSSSDSTPPASVIALFTGGTLSVNAAATDIRPEDALFATCRANSKLGGGPDGLAGLGYGANASGVCPAFGAALADLEGSDILSAYPASTSTAHLLAFAISGKDPFTGTAIPAATTVSVGAAPIIFITARTGALKTLTNATDAQLHTAFGGSSCNASAFGLAAGNIQVYLREPPSGTMNTTEYTVFRYKDFKGTSQEKGVAAQNPLNGQCTGGARHRSIGTGEEVEFVLNSTTNFGTDGIGYAFFSYGNVSTIADSASYGYLTLSGIDGIFHKYGPSPAIDPGQPTTAGELPSAADLPASCSHAFPCPENKIWNGNLSFPNLRSGSYRAWSVLRIVSNGAALTAANLLVTGAQTYAVNVVPDYVPALRVAGTDPGLGLLRSHYTQEGVAPVNISLTGDKGGDAGGCILFSSGSVGTSDTTSKLAQEAPGTSCVQVP